MTGLTIESLLGGMGAWFKGDSPDVALARSRSDISQIIAASYATFEGVRDRVIRNADLYVRGSPIPIEPWSVEAVSLLEELIRAGIAFREPNGHAVCETQGRKYLTGSWLEELAWLAAMEAGADEAVFGQVIGWKVKSFSGENEIDLIMRKGSQLGFVSCKALRSDFDNHDRKHRHRLMEALHEADNLADHFGRAGDKVAVLVTTDLIDEVKDAPRYIALMGKAAVLNVRIIPLEELALNKLAAAFGELMQSSDQESES